jgi:dimethylargininase
LKVPATLDGGDVLAVGRTLFVGLSTRTNTAAIEALIELLGPFGYEVIAVVVARSLHLKTAVTALPDGRLLVNPRWVDATKFDARDTIQAPEQEPFGANTLSLGDTVLVQASTPRTAERLMAEGYVVQAIDIGEFAKAEAGLTCMSIIVPGP